MKENNFRGEIFPILECKNDIIRDNNKVLHSLINIIDEIEKEIASFSLKTIGELIKDSSSKAFNSVLREYSEKKYNTKYPEKRKNCNDFEGVYIFFENKTPVYIGISRSLVSRLKQHANGNSSSTATLAYLMAKKENSELKSKDFGGKNNKLRERYKNEVKNLKVFIFPFKKEEYFSLSLLEIMLAIKLTTKWNTFKTH